MFRRLTIMFAVIFYMGCAQKPVYVSTVQRHPGVVEIHKRLIAESRRRGVVSNRIVEASSLPDGEPKAILKVAPEFPGGGAEGWVILVYDLNTQGETTNIVVEDGTLQKKFYKNVISATKRFLYRPVVVDGEIVSVKGVKNKLVFRLE